MQQGLESCAQTFSAGDSSVGGSQTRESGRPADLEGSPSSMTQQLYRLELMASSRPQFPHLYSGVNGACLLGLRSSVPGASWQ